MVETMKTLFGYGEIAEAFKNWLNEHKAVFCSENGVDTERMTKTIKDFFHNRFGYGSNKVYSSKQPMEFLYDISVMNCNPKEVLAEAETATVPELLLAVESELGGSGGSSRKLLLENLSEDFFKLLWSRAPYLIFIGINDATTDEELEERKKQFDAAYKKSGQTTPLLLLLIDGVRTEAKGGQIQVNAKLHIHDVILSMSH